MFALDHLFIMTAVDAPAAELLIDLGLHEGPGNVHPGQGTANRRFFFGRTFLELLWVHDEAEARSPVIAPTRLWARWQSATSGYSPFGLCVRPVGQTPQIAESLILPDTWAYKPPYLPPAWQIDVVDNGAMPSEPMLFQTPFHKQPQEREASQVRAVSHPLGVKHVTKVILHGPSGARNSPAMTQLLTSDWLFMAQEEQFHLTLEFDNCLQEKWRDLAPALPLTINW